MACFSVRIGEFLRFSDRIRPEITLAHGSSTSVGLYRIEKRNKPHRILHYEKAVTIRVPDRAKRKKKQNNH